MEIYSCNLKIQNHKNKMIQRKMTLYELKILKELPRVKSLLKFNHLKSLNQTSLKIGTQIDLTVKLQDIEIKH
jgi:hypothetical protein